MDQEGSKAPMPMIIPGSQVVRAQMIVDSNKSIYQPEMKVFTVQGTCDVHVMKLCSKQSRSLSIITFHQQSRTWEWIWGRKLTEENNNDTIKKKHKA